MMGECEEIRKCWEPDSKLHCLQKQAPLLSVLVNTSMNMDLNIFSSFGFSECEIEQEMIGEECDGIRKCWEPDSRFKFALPAKAS